MTYNVVRLLLMTLLMVVPVMAWAQPRDTSFTITYPGMLVKAASLADAGVVDSLPLTKCDAFINRCIAAGAFPGCRVLAAKDGKIFYDRSFGALTYAVPIPVTQQTIYDIASVSKVAATTLAVMRLYEQGRLDLDKHLRDYLIWTDTTDKGSLKIRDLLLHQAGLKAWIPFYKSLKDSTGSLSQQAFRTAKGVDQYTLPVAENLWLRCDYVDTIWKQILHSPLENAGRYVYSDLDYYFLAAVAEQITGRPINEYVAREFYRPMMLKNIGYNPLEWARRERIAPTEFDETFRGQQVQGYVHDPGAALFGGVAGHAGVFSTAGDLAVIFQMLLNGGQYRGVQYFRRETVDMFTRYGARISRRALGFDKPNADAADAGPSGDRSSGLAFGHQGFTGTCAWADPATGVVFVFLSNRVYPNAENGAINKLGVRTVVQDYLCEALGIAKFKDRPAAKKAAGL